MSERILRAVSNAVLGSLLCAGVLLPLLSVLGLLSEAVGCVALAAGLCCFMSARHLFRYGGAVMCLGALAGCGLWIAFGGGWSVYVQAFRGFALQASGLEGALPMVGRELAVCLAVPLGILLPLCCAPGSDASPALAVTVGALAALWATGEGSAIPLVAPALAASLALLALWRHPEQPALRLLPWMIAVAAAVCLLVPQTGVTSQPLSDLAQQVRDRISDYLFFTETRSVFSLANEGYYPQGSDQMGGAASPTDHLVMTVETPRRTYLRGTVKDTYTGRAWMDTLSSKRYLWIAPTNRARRASLYDEKLPALETNVTSAQTVRVTMLS